MSISAFYLTRSIHLCAQPSAKLSMSNPTKEEIHTFIDEPIVCNQTEFIDTLIDDNVICRCDIYYDNDNNANSEWYYVNMDYCDFEELVNFLCECNITHTYFKQHVWIGITTDFNEFFKDENWIKLYKLMFD